MDDEEILYEARPHPLAMLDLMAFWLALAVLGMVYMGYYDEITARVNDVLKYDFLSFIAKRGYQAVWFASILLPLVIMAVFRINFGYVTVLIGLVLGNVLLHYKVEPWYRGAFKIAAGEPAHLENIMLVAVGLIGVIGVEIFRRGHRYYLTDRRIVASFGTLMVSERSTLYSKIDDLILQKGFLGNLLGFGTVIPVTSTGLGMGQDLAIAGAGVGAGKGGPAAGIFAAGGKAKNVPRDLSMYVLFKVSDPEWVRDLILDEMTARETPRQIDETEGGEETEG